MKSTLLVRSAVVVSLLVPVAGQALAESEVDVLPESCESEIALAAAPEHLRDGAGLWLFTAEGYRSARQSENGIECIVNRDDPRVLKPTCFDAEGAAAIVPKIVAVGEWLLEGLDAAEIASREAAGFESGRFRRVARAGVAYMLSNNNRPWNPQTQSLGRFPPHIMFYAPDITNADIGYVPGSFDPEAPLPFIGYQGPHGYMIMITGQNRSTEPGELADCPAWVRE